MPTRPRSLFHVPARTALLLLAACSAVHTPAKAPGKAQSATKPRKTDAGAAVKSDPGADGTAQPGVQAMDAAVIDAGAASDAASGDGGALAKDAGPGDAGSTDAGRDTGTTDSAACGSLPVASSLRTVPKPQNLLIIWDRSTSMDEMWNGMVKWQAAGSAMMQALTPLKDQLTIGVILFPSPDPNADGGLDCTVHPVTAPDQINFMPGAAALSALMAAGPNNCPMPLYSSVTACNLGETPTTEAVQQANNTLINATLNGTTVAIIVTDGEPNCNWEQSMTTTTIANWLSQWQIKTYVVGLPGSSSGNGPTVLNALAQAGGTMQYITPTDSMVLQQKLSDIITQVVPPGFDSCSIDLMPPTSTPDKLELVVEETTMPGVLEDVPHDLGSAGGWTITTDGSHVELVGGVCTSAKTGRFSKLSFELGCGGLPEIPRSHVQ